MTSQKMAGSTTMIKSDRPKIGTHSLTLPIFCDPMKIPSESKTTAVTDWAITSSDFIRLLCGDNFSPEAANPRITAINKGLVASLVRIVRKWIFPSPATSMSTSASENIQKR